MLDDSSVLVDNGIFHGKDFVPHPQVMKISYDVRSCRALPSQAEIRRLWTQAQGDESKLREIKEVLSHFTTKVFLPGEAMVEDAGPPGLGSSVNVLNEPSSTPD